MCDGDARIALNSLQLAMQSILESADCPTEQSQKTLKRVTLEAIKDGIKVRRRMEYCWIEDAIYS